MSGLVAVDKKKAWLIEIEEGMKILFQTKVPINHISTNNLKSLLETYVQKYALSDDEILHQFCRKSTRLGRMGKGYIFSSNTDGHILKKGYIAASYSSESAGICATATLVEL